MKLDKLEAVHTTLEILGHRILTDKDFDVKTILTAIIVILKEIIDYEIEKQKAPTSQYI